MKFVYDQNKKLIGTFTWTRGFCPLVCEMTLEEEVRKYGLKPVVNRLLRLGNKERAQELIEQFQI